MITVLDNGRVEIYNKYSDHAVYVKVNDIICIKKEYAQDGSDTPCCRIVFNPHAKTGLGEMMQSDYDRRGQELPVPYIFIHCSVNEVRLALREALGMSSEKISEEIGMELLAEVD